MKLNNTNYTAVNEPNLMDYFLTLEFPVEKRNKLNGKLYGSNAGYCARNNILLSMTEKDIQHSLTQKLRMELGNCTEHFFLELFENNDILIVDSLKITDNRDNISDNDKFWILFEDSQINYSGKIDFVIAKDKKELWLLDCKTTSKIPEKNSLKYVRQIQFYSAVLGIDKIGLLYQPPSVEDVYNGGLNGKVHVIDSSYESLLNVAIIAFFSNLCWKNELLPGIPNKFYKTSQCKYCDFNNYCWGNEELNLYPLIQDEQLEFELMDKAIEFAKIWMSNRKERFNLFFEKIINHK